MNIRQANTNDIDQLSILFDSYRVFYRKESNLQQAKEFLGDRINCDNYQCLWIASRN